MSSRLHQDYQTRIRSALASELGIANMLAVPRLEKIVINVGLNVNLQKDPKFTETVRRTLERITGQRPVETRSHTSVSSFKIRQGQVVGMKATLRGQRMWDFVDKLVSIVLPRTRDFWGLTPTAVDPHGNLSIGLKEHLAFPEIRSDEVERIHGLEITFVSTAKTRAHAFALYRMFGVPFKKD